MEINLSKETIQTVYNSLKATKQDLKMQLNYTDILNKKVIIANQIVRVEDALAVFEELVDSL